MISTGREYDRLVIALVIVAMCILTLYVFKCNKKNTTKIKNQEAMMSERMNYLTNQVDKTSQKMKDYMETPVLEQEEVEDTLPNPVSSTFLG